ncbi:MAG TPA: sigma 54-interacting transcriptional regulator [Bryobacteraceae bacterium]|nr:sigma 54-interacting transcriptional regulator [Bryobacteraceae bacterium]
MPDAILGSIATNQMNPMLLAVSGPLKGVLFRLTQDEVTIGRHSSNQLCIGDLSVSRHHCTIESSNGSYLVRDLGSNNGTLINGVPIQAHTLVDGDEIAVGSTVLRFVGQPPVERLDFAPRVTRSEVLPRTTIRLRQEDAALSAEDYESAVPSSAFFAVLAQIDLLIEGNNSKIAPEPLLLQALGACIPAEQGAIVPVAYRHQDSDAVPGWSRTEGICDSPRIVRRLLDLVLSQGDSVMSSDIAPEGDGSAPAATVTSALAVPLHWERSVYAIVYLDTTHVSERFHQGHLRFVRALSSSIALALVHTHLQRNDTEVSSAAPGTSVNRHGMIGESASMRKIHDRIDKIAPTDATVLIGGETGTGKELAAKAIHAASPRSDKPFEALNCALLNETMLESELFGHEKGAFTGASAMRKGKLEIADGGTIFLDEIGELPLQTQAMLLRVLQDRTFYRMGGTRKMHVDIRVVAATNRNLPEAIRARTFREDLYYRLNVVSLSMPPLRERREDVPDLADHFLTRASEANKRRKKTISARTLRLLKAYNWPGNVRELENAIRHAVVFGESTEVEPEDLPETLLDKAAEPGSTSVLSYHDAVRESRKQIVLKALQHANGDYAGAAALLDIHVNNLHRLIRDFNLRDSIRGDAEKSGT